ncbi:MAG: mucoidy inhibitor MuiA family protein [Candidatus Njordarchaeota archaeon]
MIKENTRIKKVKLLLGKCIIEREAEIDLTFGLNKIILEPFESIDEIISVGCSEGKILSYRFKNVSVPMIDILSDEASKIVEKKNELLRKIHAYEGEKTFLESEIQGILVGLKRFYNSYARENIRHGTDIAVLDKQVKNLHDRLSDRKKKLFEVNMRLEELKNKLRALLKNLEQLQNDIVNIGRVELVIDSEKETKAIITVKIMSSIASWRPKYRLNIDGDKAVLQHLVVLEQKSPLPWRSIDLEITTLKPTKARYVEPEPWFIWPVRPVVRAKRTMAMEKALPEALPEAAAPSEFVEVVEEFEGVVTFRVSKKVTILPNESITLDVFKAEIEPEFYFVWDAFKGASVFEVVEFENKGACILGGHCDVFVEGILVNSFSVGHVPVGAKAKWVLREEPNIKVSRKLVKRDEKTKGLISEKAYIDLAYELEIENRLRKEVQVRVYDRIPKPRDPKIEVKVKQTEPKASISDMGIVEWNIKLEPGGKKIMRIAYIVYFPPSYRLSI